jgi:hypothetical protein
MVEHWRDSFPEKVESMEEPAMRESIRHGIERAAAYALVEEYDVCLFLDLIVHLGRDFDKDPKHESTVAILKDPADAPPDRVERAWEKIFEPETENEGEE